MSMHPSNAPDLRVSINSDLPVTPAWSALWRRLLRDPAADLPLLAGDLADAIGRAELLPESAPEPVLSPRPESEASR